MHVWFMNLPSKITISLSTAKQLCCVLSIHVHDQSSVLPLHFNLIPATMCQNDSHWVAVDRKHAIVSNTLDSKCREHRVFFRVGIIWIRMPHPLALYQQRPQWRAEAWHCTYYILSNVISIFVRRAAEAVKWKCVSSKSIIRCASLFIFSSHAVNTLFALFFYFVLLNCTVYASVSVYCLNNKHDILIRTLLWRLAPIPAGYSYTLLTTHTHSHNQLLIFRKCTHRIANSLVADTT